MNCQRFEAMVADIASDRMLDATARDAALDHASRCESCAARLADERMLTSCLREIATTSSYAEAPDRVEAALVAAFRAGAAERPQPAPARRWRVLEIAAAAAILLAAAAGIVAYVAQPAKKSDIATNAPVPAPAPKPISGEERELAPPPIEPPDAPREPDVMAVDYSSRGSNRARRGKPVRPSTGVDQDELPVNRELTTPFYPISAGSETALLEGGQLVRVEVPRASLASLGLPVNAARANERITADILLGNDGVARAIRFVQPQPGAYR